ncbi:MAG: hypothetical protein EGS62_06860 [Ruminococcus sp.]|nr:hypothetical protein [Ruminococcus sp.]
MWFLCQEPCKTLDQARKIAMEIGRENFDSIHKERCGLFFKRTVYVVLWWKWIEKGEEKQMINLTGKSVFVKTQEEYLSVLKTAKLQGFTWARENHLNPIVIPFPNILNFYDSKIVTYNYVEKTVYEVSEIVEDEEKIKDAVKLVRTFAKYPDRTALTESFIDSLKLLADTVESQMEEVK